MPVVKKSRHFLKLGGSAVLVMLYLLYFFALPASARERSEIPLDLTWNLNDIYPNLSAWQDAYRALAEQIPDIASFQGHLGDSPQDLAKALAKILSVRKELEKLNTYASCLSDQDTRDSKNYSLVQDVNELEIKISAAQSYFQPELLALGKDKLNSFLAASPELKTYHRIFEQVYRLAPHTLTPDKEKILALAQNLEGAGASIRGILANADLPYPEVKLSSGEVVRLDPAGYTKYRALANPQDREIVFQAFFKSLQSFRRTFGTTLYSHLKAHEFEKEVRNYDSTLQAALFPNEIPEAVYTQLIADVHANLPTLHRYLRLRAKLMGVEKLKYEDLYAPILKGEDKIYSPEQAKKLTLRAVAPLGEEYQKILVKLFDERWQDLLPSTGKRSGAYSNGGAYDIHPYQLLNFNGGFEDVSTLAHESGHSIHSYLANTSQPYGLHDYPIFVAEVASTLNENLLVHDMLANSHSSQEKLFLLGNYLENLRGTLFRQTLLAEFELAIHQKVEAGRSLTGDDLSALYLELLKKYYGDSLGVCSVDDLYGIEWAYIPHFYYNFYVYQYSTSIVASTSIASTIRSHGKEAAKAYLNMLSAGASRDPISLLKSIGVDMTTSKPFKEAMHEMNEVMDQMEQILKIEG